MEGLVDPDEKGFYQLGIENIIINPSPLFVSVIADLHNQTPISKISAKFHNSITKVSVDICKHIREKDHVDTVALSGGVWQNKVLLTNTTKQLKIDGFDVLIHRNVPTNDGGLSLGQAVIASKYKLNNE